MIHVAPSIRGAGQKTVRHDRSFEQKLRVLHRLYGTMCRAVLLTVRVELKISIPIVASTIVVSLKLEERWIRLHCSLNRIWIMLLKTHLL